MKEVWEKVLVELGFLPFQDMQYLIPVHCVGVPMHLQSHRRVPDFV